jgi:hypothetical protein
MYKPTHAAGLAKPQWPRLSRLESTRTPESTAQVQKGRRYASGSVQWFGKFDWGDAKSLRMWGGQCTCILLVYFALPTTATRKRMLPQVELDLYSGLHDVPYGQCNHMIRSTGSNCNACSCKERIRRASLTNPNHQRLINQRTAHVSQLLLWSVRARLPYGQCNHMSTWCF